MSGAIFARFLPLLYDCDHYDILLPDGHKFPMEKYRLIRQKLEGQGGFRFASQIRRIGFSQVSQWIARTLSSVGATVAASRLALDEGLIRKVAVIDLDVRPQPSQLPVSQTAF